MSDQGSADVITFGKKPMSADEEAAYREKIRKAKEEGVNALKGGVPVGGIERPKMPDLAQLQAMRGSSGTDGIAQEGVSPRPPGSPVLSAHTAEQLRQMNEVQSQTAKAEESIKKEVEDNKDDIFDAFDFMARNEAERVLNNKQRRKEIESRCEPMSLDDLIIKDEVTQRVPVIPKKFEITFRTMSPEESLFVKQFLAKEQSPNEAYALEKFSLCQLACSLVAINGVDFPDHRKPDGTPDEELFKIKLKKLMKKSGYVIADLGLNFIWFDIRVRKLLSPDKLGNG